MVRHPRTYRIYRPREHECPTWLTQNEIIDEKLLDSVRIARDEERVIAGYRFQRPSLGTGVITILYVIEAYRQQGLGKWMLAHALGILESKGCRVAYADVPYGRSFFLKHNFIEVGQRIEYSMTPD